MCFKFLTIVFSFKQINFYKYSYTFKLMSMIKRMCMDVH